MQILTGFLIAVGLLLTAIAGTIAVLTHMMMGEAPALNAAQGGPGVASYTTVQWWYALLFVVLLLRRGGLPPYSVAGTGFAAQFVARTPAGKTVTANGVPPASS